MTTSTETHGPSGGEARGAGIALIGVSLLAVIMMAHHPTAGSHDAASLAAEISDKAQISRIVHGVLIAVIAVQLYAFVVFSERIAGSRAASRAALLAYAIGSSAMIGAALISGFVVSDLGARYASLPSADANAFVDLARLAMAGNQALAKLGVIAMSTGILLWSIALFRGARENRWLAFVGAIASLGPAIALAAGAIRLDVNGMMIVVLVEAAWNVAAGWILIRSKS